MKLPSGLKNAKKSLGEKGGATWAKMGTAFNWGIAARSTDGLFVKNGLKLMIQELQCATCESELAVVEATSPVLDERKPRPHSAMRFCRENG
jgi:hypothetical protein